MATPDQHHNGATGPEHLLQKGLGDLVEFGREFIADPDVVERIRRLTPLN